MTGSNGTSSLPAGDLRHDLERILYSREQIAERVQELGQQISHDYQGKKLVLVGILKGGILFLSDLSREIAIPHEFDLVGAESYKGGTHPTEDVRITKDIDLSIEGKHVLLVEDIFDTGNTLRVLRKMLKIYRPESIEICALLAKRKPRANPVELKYVGFEIDDVFVVGYGLDYKERYRNLNCVGVLHPEFYS
jgi:hypoxanthine phosphoribosyltransferase